MTSTIDSQAIQKTPLLNAPDLARTLDVAQVLVKDETCRFDLPSFKILGASWATYVMLRQKLGPIPGDSSLLYDDLQTWAAPLKQLTLIAASDGNHGRAVARVAKWFGLNSRIFLPDFVSIPRRRSIEAEDAEVIIVKGLYDASVDAAIEAAKQNDTLLISDTARSVTDVVPQLVTDGYTTAFTEVDRQLQGLSIDTVSIQAGVGGLSSACTSWARTTHRNTLPHIIVVEPEKAACVMSALAAGEPVSICADKISAMSVLQCGTISFTAFKNLNAGVSCCLAIEDSWATSAVSSLAACDIHTGPSGATGLAGLIAAFTGPFATPIREHLGISGKSRLLVLATEATKAADYLE